MTGAAFPPILPRATATGHSYAVPVALAAILATISICLRPRHRRDMSCSWDTLDAPVRIAAGQAIGGDIEILYGGQKVADIAVYRCRIANTGTLPVGREQAGADHHIFKSR